MYGYDDIARPASRSKSDHERIITSGAWWATAGVTCGMVWISTKVPYFAAWLLNSSVTIGVSYAMARWKQAWYAWACFWVIVAVSLLNGLLKAATSLLDSSWSGTSWILAWIIVGAWYWLIRIGRRRPPEVPQVIHVVHHHVTHPGIPAAGPEWEATAVTGTQSRPVAATPRKAIAAATLSPGDVGQRLGRLGVRVLHPSYRRLTGGQPDHKHVDQRGS